MLTDDDEKPGKWWRGLHNVSDHGMILLAAICTMIFVGILFSHWHLDKIGTAFAEMTKPTIVAKPETDMMLFPSPAPSKKPKQ